MVRLAVELAWSEEDNWWICERHQLAKEVCDWREISQVCMKLSGLLDCHDRDRFALLLHYGGG